MTVRGWRLPPGDEMWAEGPWREAPGGAALAAPDPDAGEARALLARLSAAAPALSRLPVREVAATLGAVGARFRDEADPLRERALVGLPGTAGISPPQARYVLDGMARDWTPAALLRLLEADFNDPGVLDAFQGAPGTAGREGQLLRARPLGPNGGVGVHVCAGTVPGVSLTSLLRGLLVKGPVLLKPGAGDVLLPLLFLEGLHEATTPASRTLAAAAAVTWWPGGRGGVLEEAALDGAGHVVVYGGDDTVAEVQRRVAPAVPVVTYPHRVSLAVLGPAGPAESGRQLARAVAAYDQRGCVSPQHAFVIGSRDDALAVGEATAAELDSLDRTLPPGPATPNEAAAVQQLRGTAEMRAAIGQDVRILQGPGTRWTVVVDTEPVFRPSCLSRTIHVTPIPEEEALAAVLAPLAPHLQTVGTAGLDADSLSRVAEVVAEIGASRVAPMEAMAFPGPGWKHDGQGPLRRLVRWCGWESPGKGGG